MIHVVFQSADVDVLKEAIVLDPTLEGEIFEIKDDLAVGMIKDIDTEEGWQQRQEWWRGLVDNSPSASLNLVGSFDDRETVVSIKASLEADPAQELWIWMAQNAHDVCGYYWLVSQLKEYSGRVNILYFNNLPFINEKGQIFYPTAIHQIRPSEFLKAKKLHRKITPSEFEIDPEEWTKLMNETGLVRILEGGKKIVGKEDDFFDKDVLTALTGDWQKGNKAMNSILSKMKIKTGDIFLLWRARNLEQMGRVEFNGESNKTWKDFEIKLKTSANAESAPATAIETN